MSLPPVLICLVIAPSQTSSEDVILVRADRLYDATTVSVDVLDDGEVFRANSLADALMKTPGVDIVAQGAVGATEILLRGGDANFTAVTLEGVRLNDVTDSRGGAVDVGAIAPFEISRTYIAKGAVSVLEGSEALAGQIALETSDPLEGPRVQAMARYGDSGLVSINGEVTPWRNDSAALSLTGATFDYGDAPGGQSFTRSSLSAKLTGETGGRRWSAYVRHGKTSREVFPDASGGDRLAVLRDLEKSDAALTIASVRYNTNSESDWSPSAIVTYLHRTEDRETPAIPPSRPAGMSMSTFTRATVVSTVSHRFSEKWRALVGAEIAHEVGKTDSVLDFGYLVPANFDLDRTTPSVFAEAKRTAANRGSASGVDVYVGVRGDYVDTDQFVPSVRAGATYHLPGGATALRASAGSGFKAPSFYAIGDPLVGNPDLDDERSITGEIGITHAFSAQTTVDASAYYSHYRDLIDFDVATFSLVNRAEVDVTGVEAQIRHNVSNHMFSAFAVYTSTDAPAGTVLLRPAWRVGAGWRYTSGSVTLDASYLYRSETEASSAPTGIVTLNGSHRLDLSASYQITDGAAIALTLDDAADSVEEMQPGFSPFGRRIGIRLDVAY